MTYGIMHIYFNPASGCQNDNKLVCVCVEWDVKLNAFDLCSFSMCAMHILRECLKICTEVGMCIVIFEYL